MIEIVTQLGLAFVQTWNMHVLIRFVFRIYLMPELVMGNATCLTISVALLCRIALNRGEYVALSSPLVHSSYSLKSVSSFHATP